MTNDQREVSKWAITKKEIRKRMKEIEREYYDESPYRKCGKKSCNWKKCDEFEQYVSDAWQKIQRRLRGD